MRKAPRSHHQPRCGYLLLTVMVTIVIAGMFLAALARQSMLLATEAIERQQDLQLRWGMESGQRALLPAAGTIFRDQQEAAKRRRARSRRAGNQTRSPLPATIRLALPLGKLRFEFLIADEDAKLNLNTVYHYQGQARAEQVLQESARQSLAVPTKLLPEVESLRLARRPPDEEDDEGRPAAFRSFGQLFDLERMSVGSANNLLPVLAREVTCWGNGRLNLVRATDDTIRQIGSLAIPRGKIQQLIREYRKAPDTNLERLVDQLAFDPLDRFRIQDLLTEQSSCYSLWVTASCRSRLWRQLSISEQFEEGQARSQSFVLW